MLTLRSRNLRKFLWLIPALSVVLGGCVTTGDTADSNPFAAVAAIFTPEKPEDLSPEERQMRGDANVFRYTVLGGAGTGAAIGGLMCILNYGTDDLDKCAAYAAVGGLVGAMDGYLTAKKQKASRQKVHEIDLITEEIDERNARIRKMVDSSHKVVEQNRKRIEEVKQQVAQNEVQEERLAEEEKRLQANIDVMDKTITTLMEDKAAYEAIANKLEQDGENVAGLRSKVEIMNLQIAELEQERNELEKIYQTVRVG
jgi:hypothetical protein